MGHESQSVAPEEMLGPLTEERCLLVFIIEAERWSELSLELYISDPALNQNNNS